MPVSFEAKPSELVEATMFKRVGDRYLLRAPGFWPFRPARHYLVDQAQKDAILARLKRHRTRGLLLALVVWLMLIAAIVALIALLTGHDDPTVVDFLVILVLALVTFVLCMQNYTVLIVRPMTAGLAETSEPFTFRERLEAARKSARNAKPFRQPVLLGALYSVGCAANTFAFLLSTSGARHLTWRDGAPFSTLFVAVLLGGLAVRFFLLELIVTKQNADPEVVADTMSGTDALALRLERLEFENRRLLRVLASLAALACALGIGAAATAAFMLGVNRPLNAGSLVLRNPKGDIAALLSIGKAGSPALSLYGPDKNLSMFMGLTSTGAPQLAFYGPDQALRFIAGIAGDGLPVVRLNGVDGKVRLGLVVNTDQSWLTLSDPKGTTRLSLSAGTMGGRVRVLDADGKEQEHQ